MALNWGGAAGGAASGAAMGSMVGPWGTAIGGVAGGLMGLFSGSEEDKMKKLATMTPEQKQMLGQLLQMLSPGGSLGQGQQESTDYLRQLMNPSSAAVNQFTQPYMDQFNQQTIPGLAERFAGAGSMGGGLSSSGFGQSLGTAGGNLQTQLAALKASLGAQASQTLMGQFGNLSGQAMNAQPFGYQNVKGGPGFGETMFSGWANQGFPGLQNLFGGQGTQMQNSTLKRGY